MIKYLKKLKSFMGIKEYLIEIIWNNGAKEIVSIKAYSPMKAIIKVAETKDVVNKAKMTILNHRKYIEVRHCRVESLGIAVKKDN